MGKMPLRYQALDWLDAGLAAWVLALFLAALMAGCGVDKLPPEGPCAARDGRVYLETFVVLECSGCDMNPFGWTTQLVGTGDACEQTFSWPGVEVTLTWEPDGSGATGTMTIAATTPPTPGPSPGTYSVTVVPAVPHGAP